MRHNKMFIIARLSDDEIVYLEESKGYLVYNSEHGHIVLVWNAIAAMELVNYLAKSSKEFSIFEYGKDAIFDSMEPRV